LVLQEGMLLALLGLALGLVGSYFVARAMQSVLFEIKGSDPLAVGSVSAVLLAAALLACYLPARRATEVDPMVALRDE
jgi:putative ABC transport system permease protein